MSTSRDPVGRGVLWLGYTINLLSYVIVSAVLWGCYHVLLRGAQIAIDPGLAAAVGGIVGGVVQWAVANALQANSFFFGSSPGSRQAAADMGAAVTEAVRK
jgi:hypothetical protein